MRNRFVEVNTAVLGPRELRSPFKPERGAASGGTRFERMPHSVSVKKKGDRAYTLGPTTQHAPNLVGPTANAKVIGELDEEMKLRKEMLDVSLPASYSMPAILM